MKMRLMTGLLTVMILVTKHGDGHQMFSGISRRPANDGQHQDSDRAAKIFPRFLADCGKELKIVGVGIGGKRPMPDLEGASGGICFLQLPGLSAQGF
jgi:hypothetical protein